MATMNDLDRVRTPEAWNERLMQRVEEEKNSTAKRTGWRMRTGLLIAAVVAVLGIGITAVAGGLWNNSGRAIIRRCLVLSRKASVKTAQMRISPGCRGCWMRTIRSIRR